MNNTIQKLKIDEIQLEILNILSKFPSDYFTVDKVLQLLKESNYATVYRKVDSLVKQGILSKAMYGQASQISINLRNEETISLLSLIETKHLETFLTKLKGNLLISVREIIKDTRNISELKCILVFGSYAKGTQTKNSDLDLLIIQEPSKIAIKHFSKEKLENYIKEARSAIMGIIKTNELRGGPKINPIIISNEDYKEMMQEKGVNVGREALSDHIIIKGFSEYWRVIAECYQEEK
ncbi:MAG: nucleotidyltransferase domain-containing protein [Candidatus Coatesbacteria bacterium]|nr:nucleotidyltransferase domain-containing protein [Candidatus Coatesbacteria bacterium]